MRKRASITVFSALAFALVASFLMALLEAGRVYQIQTYADMKSTLALESVCAEYQPVLWEEFHLLGLDGAYGGDTFSMDHVTAVLRERLDRNLDVDGAGGSILQVTLAGAEPVAYRLMTDQDGSVFLHCVAAYMKQNMAMETIRTLQERYGEHEQVEQSGQGEESIEDARTAIEEAKNERREQAESGGTEAEIPELPPEQENPLEVVHAIKQNALLGMTLGDFGAVSTRQTDLGDSIERRQKQTGNMEIQVSDWYDRILALEYMDQYFGDYLGESEDHALAYELEYVLAGKGSDKENMESVIKRLLFVREAANITHLELSIRSVAEAEIAALRNENGEAYRKCMQCRYAENAFGRLYITNQGDCYHKDLGCSGIKRTVRMIRLSEVGTRRPCSRCGQ